MAGCRDPEFKPCPFCGRDDIRSDLHRGAGRGEHRGEDVWTMCCYSCGATFPGRYRKELLVESWNRRASAGARAALESPSQRPKYQLDELLKGATPENSHGEIDW